ncbi:hypothetical protein CYMTET_42285 [Cymbomonas tetramitiformis]|uniref:Uncharacterized protein n=1 Tax=Cymbomonas tetramitiformis TaxID=36881 RepID=A0AAE0F1E1_9CHLO|nr:hypothetical protein CYMTET_42285 [Cymbomonas tetramitiformis]
MGVFLAFLLTLVSTLPLNHAGLAIAPQSEVSVSVLPGSSLTAGGYSGPSHNAVPKAVLKCLRGAPHNQSVIAFVISGWAPTPNYYNISALVETIRSAREAGLVVWISAAFDENQLSPEQVLPTLVAIKQAGLAAAVERVFVLVEGDPFIWGEGVNAIRFMISAIELIEKHGFAVGIKTNSVQWSWITANITKYEQQQVSTLPLWLIF